MQTRNSSGRPPLPVRKVSLTTFQSQSPAFVRDRKLSVPNFSHRSAERNNVYSETTPASEFIYSLPPKHDDLSKQCTTPIVTSSFLANLENSIPKGAQTSFSGLSQEPQGPPILSLPPGSSIPTSHEGPPIPSLPEIPPPSILTLPPGLSIPTRPQIPAPPIPSLPPGSSIPTLHEGPPIPSLLPGSSIPTPPEVPPPPIPSLLPGSSIPTRPQIPQNLSSPSKPSIPISLQEPPIPSLQPILAQEFHHYVSSSADSIDIFQKKVMREEFSTTWPTDHRTEVEETLSMIKKCTPLSGAIDDLITTLNATYFFSLFDPVGGGGNEAASFLLIDLLERRVKFFKKSLLTLEVLFDDIDHASFSVEYRWNTLSCLLMPKAALTSKMKCSDKIVFNFIASTDCNLAKSLICSDNLSMNDSNVITCSIPLVMKNKSGTFRSFGFLQRKQLVIISETSEKHAKSYRPVLLLPLGSKAMHVMSCEGDMGCPSELCRQHLGIYTPVSHAIFTYCPRTETSLANCKAWKEKSKKN